MFCFGFTRLITVSFIFHCIHKRYIPKFFVGGGLSLLLPACHFGPFPLAGWSLGNQKKVKGKKTFPNTDQINSLKKFLSCSHVTLFEKQA
jgi:hypothetical protein